MLRPTIDSVPTIAEVPRPASVADWFMLEKESIGLAIADCLAAGESGAWVEWEGIEISAWRAAQKQSEEVATWLERTTADEDLTLVRGLASTERTLFALTLAPELDAELEQQLTSLVEGLEQPEALAVDVQGETARVTTPNGHWMELSREDGMWRVRDFE